MTLESLEARIARLEYRERLMFLMLDSSKDPWRHFILENDLDEGQATGIMAVMESTHNLLEKGTQIDAPSFEGQLLLFMPEKQKSARYHFVQTLLATLTQYDKVCNHFRDDYNVPTRERLEL